MTLTGLLRIIFRWKKPGLAVFGILLFCSLVLALAIPRVYESQVILERKPVKITPVVTKQDDEEFDVYRLTSETQRSVALMKSRFMMERWMDAIGLKPATARQTETELAKLLHSLTVQPINYTDLFIVKVRSFSPEEAARRAKLLADRFSEWDAQMNEQDAQQMRVMLRERMDTATNVLAQQYGHLKNQKAGQSLSLSGSSAASALEVNIAAQGKLYDMLTTELEEVERQIQNGQLSRTRILTPPTRPGKPVLSYARRILLALCASALAAIGFIFFLEWQDPTIRRTQDIVREIPSYPVLTIPAHPNGSLAPELAPYLSLAAEVIGNHARAHGSALIQLVSASDAEGQTPLYRSLAHALSGDFQILVTDHALGLAPLDGMLTQTIKLTCILVTAGRTSRYFLRALRNSLQRFPKQNLFFILNHYEDPLPAWIRSPFTPRVGL